MNYALNLAKNNRILSAWVVLPNRNYDGMPIVTTLPDGNLVDYRYVNGVYVLDPLPRPDESQQQPGLEERITAMESSISSITAAIEKGLAL